MYDRVYLERILEWANYLIDVVQNTLQFALAVDSPQLDGAARRSFCRYLLRSVCTAVWFMR